MIATDLLCGSLDDAWDTAQAAPRALRVQLRIYETAARARINAGSLSAVTANGRTSEFSRWGPGQVSPAEWQETWRKLIRLFDMIQIQITRDDALSVPAGDAVVYAGMMAYLVPATESYIDMTYLNLQPPEDQIPPVPIVDHRAVSFDLIVNAMADGYLYDRKPIFVRAGYVSGDGQGGGYTFVANSPLPHNPLLVIKPTATGVGLGAFIKDF